MGPPGLAKYGTLVNVITCGEHVLDKTDGNTFEEQGTDSRTCEGDSTNVAGLITDCTGDFDATAGVPDSAAMGGGCNLVSSSGTLQEKGTLPMDKDTFTENVPSDAKGVCELEEKHEQSMLSVSQGCNLCRDDTDAEKCQKICGSCTETSLPIPSSTSPHTPSPPVPVPAPTPSPSNVMAEGDPHVSSLTDHHRQDGDAPHEDGPETGSDPGVTWWCTRPSAGLPRTARAFIKVARLRQAAKKWQPDFEKYFEEMRDSLTGEELDALLPTEEALRYFTSWATHQWVQIQYGATRMRFLYPGCRG